jgi:hypothetical protein
LDALLSALRAGDPDPTPLATADEEAADEQTAAEDAGSSSSTPVKQQQGAASEAAVSTVKVSSAVDEQQQQQQKLVKVVLARRTALPWQNSPETQQQQWSGDGQSTAAAAGASLRPGWQRVSGAVLLQALQERDPRAYQLYLSTPPGRVWKGREGQGLNNQCLKCGSRVLTDGFTLRKTHGLTSCECLRHSVGLWVH